MRFVLFKLFPMHGSMGEAAKNIVQIPWFLAFGVFWEDMLHALPLILLQKLIGTQKKTWPIHILATAVIMASFGLGHTYQGAFAAFALSFYIPYSVQLGKKFGLGTVMICHILYDLSTILFLKFMLGA